MEGSITYTGSLEAIVTRANGTVEDFGIISGAKPVTAVLAQPMSWYEKLWNILKREGKIPATMGLFAFIAYLLNDHHASTTMLGIVTTAGVGYQANTSTGTTLNTFNYHDCGTGGAYGSTKTITGATNASPIVITATGHGYGTNDIVTVASVGGNTAANATWQITVLTANTFSLIGSTGNAAYTSGGTSEVVNGAGDTALTTAAGTARVAGTQSNPSANVYKSVATISFTSSLSISEWGLFTASTSGTVLDRRWFNTAGAPASTPSTSLTGSTIGVNNGDSIQFTYSLTLIQGGS